jgi:hypothetical protein
VCQFSHAFGAPLRERRKRLSGTIHHVRDGKNARRYRIVEFSGFTGAAGAHPQLLLKQND